MSSLEKTSNQRTSQNSLDGDEEKNDHHNEQFYYGLGSSSSPASTNAAFRSQPNKPFAQASPSNLVLEKRRQLLFALLQRLGVPVTQLTQPGLDIMLSNLMTPSYANERYGPTSEERRLIKFAEMDGDARYNYHMFCLMQDNLTPGFSPQAFNALKDFFKGNKLYQGWMANECLRVRDIFLLAADEVAKNPTELPRPLASSCLEILIHFIWKYALSHEIEEKRDAPLKNVIANMLGQPFKEACQKLDYRWESSQTAIDFLTKEVMVTKK